MNYTNLKHFPYLRKSDVGEGETFFPVSEHLPNGVEKYAIMLKVEDKEYRVLAISRLKGSKEVVVHTTDGMLSFPLGTDFRLNVYNTDLFVSA